MRTRRKKDSSIGRYATKGLTVEKKEQWEGEEEWGRNGKKREGRSFPPREGPNHCKFG